MALDDVITAMKQKLQFAPPLGARIVFDLGDEGVLSLDGRSNPPIIEEKRLDEAETTLTMTKANLHHLIQGTLDPTMAFMTGKLKVTGKMGYALKLASLLED